MPMYLKKILKILLIISGGIAIFLGCYFFVGKAPAKKDILWGVNFSQMQAEDLKMDWRKMYLAILQDLGVRHIKLITNWNFVEGKQDQLYFSDIDWQLEQAKKYQADIIYVVGMKTGRWPECHIPSWATNLSKQEQQSHILSYIEQIVLRYKNDKTIVAWQAENEPLFGFGICPWYDEDFLRKEVALIKSLDSTRPVIVSDSGDQSLWLKAANIGDILGITMYKKVRVNLIGNHGFYFEYLYPPLYYWRKAQLLKAFTGKEVINVELQAEPWAAASFLELPLQEQEKTMSPTRFKKNVEYAKKTGLSQVYLWGVEWMYWMKEVQKKPEIWDAAKELFQKN